MTIQGAIRSEVIRRIQAVAPWATIQQSLRRETAQEELPCIIVYSHGDRAQDEDQDHAQAHERVYTLRVEIRVDGRPEEDATDELATVVRRAVLPDDPDGRTLAGLVRRTTWSAQEWAGDEGEFPLAGTALDFSFYYQWRPE